MSFLDFRPVSKKEHTYTHVEEWEDVLISRIPREPVNASARFEPVQDSKRGFLVHLIQGQSGVSRKRDFRGHTSSICCTIFRSYKT